MFEIFKDTNDWNEKSIIGFIAFGIMVIVMILDAVSGFAGTDLVINKFVAVWRNLQKNKIWHLR